MGAEDFLPHLGITLCVNDAPDRQCLYNLLLYKHMYKSLLVSLILSKCAASNDQHWGFFFNSLICKMPKRGNIINMVLVAILGFSAASLLLSPLPHRVHIS